MNKIIKTAALISAAISLTAIASAAKITGDIAFTGNATLNGSVTTATAFTTFDNVEVANFTQTGGYLGTDGAAVSMTAFSFDPFAGPVNPLWTFTVGPNTYSFVLESVTSIVRNAAAIIPTLTISGKGIASATGFEDAAGDWTITTQGNQSRVSFSSATTVPDGGASAVLLGLGLLGLAAIRRFKR